MKIEDLRKKIRQESKLLYDKAHSLDYIADKCDIDEDCVEIRQFVNDKAYNLIKIRMFENGECKIEKYKDVMTQETENYIKEISECQDITNASNLIEILSPYECIHMITIGNTVEEILRNIAFDTRKSLERDVKDVTCITRDRDYAENLMISLELNAYNCEIIDGSYCNDIPHSFVKTTIGNDTWFIDITADRFNVNGESYNSVIVSRTLPNGINEEPPSKIDDEFMITI